MHSSLKPFFQPQGIVVIGASTSPEKLGYGLARNLSQSGYQGAIHFVSQKPGELFGRLTYTDVNLVPDPVELAILMVPPQATPKTIEECGKRGIRAAIILSSGFKEVGMEGAVLEKECLEIAQANGMRLLGPNCIGIIDTHLPLDTSFLQPPMPAPGPIGFISHSGAFCAAVIDWGRRQGLGFSKIVSLGNQADVNETDALAALAEDEHTRVIVLYMESVADGCRFVEVAREVTRHKPVIALKAGRSDSGQQAAASHTGALAASDIAFDAAFEKAGILRADSAEQVFDWARLLAIGPLPRGNRFAILTNAGGPGVMAADALERNGLQLAQLIETTRNALSAQLPPSANIHNPVDMLASASPEAYAACLGCLLEDHNVDGVLVILPPPPMFKAEDVAEKLVQVIRFFDKPVVAAVMGSTLVEKAVALFQLSNVPTYPFPERAASALGALVKRAKSLNDGRETIDHAKSSIIYRPWSNTEELFAAYGIENAPIKLVRSIEEATSLADELGYPVVLKIASPDILHKSDVGGVHLNIQNVQALNNAYTQILDSVRAMKPRARIEGVYIQRQIAEGQDVIVGAVRDLQFGPLMMFGSGGVEVEGLKDVAFSLAPLSQAEAQKMVDSTWAGRKLGGFRHISPADKESVVDVLIKLSHLILENESIDEIEINPLKVLNQGAIAVDVRIAVRGKD